MSEPSLRPARREDLEALLELYGELHEERPLPAGERAAQVLQAILAQPKRHLVVATLDGRRVGSADMLIVENLTHGARPWAIVENVIVAGSVRRSGIGAALIEHLISLARSAGCYKVQLLSARRRQAHAFYESLGFEALSNGFKLYLRGDSSEAERGREARA